MTVSLEPVPDRVPLPPGFRAAGLHCGLKKNQQFDLGLRAESRFSFSFTLKGIGSFGNLKRPESLF